MARSHGVYQSEAAECGLACLATCLSFLGAPTNLSTLRQRFQIGSRGMSIREIKEVAAATGLVTRAVRCELDELRSLKIPAILHYEFSHFVVLLGLARDGRLKIFDPAIGNKLIAQPEMSRAFTGIALEVSAVLGFQRRKERSPLSIFSLFSLRGNVLAALGKALLLSLFLQVYVLASPFYLQLAIDEAALKSDLSLLMVLAIGFGAFALFNTIAETLRSLAVQYASAMIGWEMSTRLFRHLIRLPLVWFQRRKLADTLTRFDSIEPIKNLVSGGLVAAVFDGVLALTLIAMMFVYSPLLAMISIIFAFIVVATKIASLRPLQDIARQSLQAMVAEKGKKIETLRGIQTIKLLSGEVLREADWANKLGESISTTQRSANFQAYLKGIYSLIEAVGVVLVVYFGARSIVEGALSIGMLYAFISYRQQFSSRLSTLVDQAIAWKMLDIHSDRLADIALQSKEPNVDAGETSALPMKGSIEMRDVFFSYSKNDQSILNGMSISIRQGELVAIVGESGCGKSTFIKVLTGLYKPSRGVVLIDGLKLDAQGAHWVRNNISVVMQDDEMFSGSVLDNVTFFAEQHNIADVWGALTVAQLADDIRAMPMQLHTLIGDMGMALSGGQRQRLLIARAIYRKPRILIMDEATSNLDVAKERDVHDAMEALQITRIFVTHRPGVAKRADRVYAFKKGKAIEYDQSERPNS